jgi:RNA polymerase sigma factor (TIGR02999 family)
MTTERHTVTQLLKSWSGGDQAALDQLMPMVYKELQRLAHGYLRRERPDHTLETAALVHEAYVKLVDAQQIQWQGRAHFLAIAARLMRQILVDHARGHSSRKRGGGAARLSLDEARFVAGGTTVDVLALDEALRRLADTDARKSRLVELRFFGGLSHEEIAEVLGISLSTVERQWRLSRAWLYAALTNHHDASSVGV